MEFNLEQIPAIGYNSNDTNYNLPDGTTVKVKIYDNGGQERFNSLTNTFYNKVDSCILVYDITNKTSFEKCTYFSESIRERSKNGINVFLIGNKLDYNEYRQVSIEDGLNYAIRNGYYFYETSCKNNTNIQIVFQKLIEETVKKKELEDDENGIDNLILTIKVIKPQKKTFC